jgi:hypothetical protein
MLLVRCFPPSLPRFLPRCFPFSTWSPRSFCLLSLSCLSSCCSSCPSSSLRVLPLLLHVLPLLLRVSRLLLRVSRLLLRVASPPPALSHLCSSSSSCLSSSSFLFGLSSSRPSSCSSFSPCVLLFVSPPPCLARWVARFDSAGLRWWWWLPFVVVGRCWFMSSSSSGSLWLDSLALGNVAVAVVTAVCCCCCCCCRGGGCCRWVAQVAHIPWERGGAAAAASLLVRELGRC